MGAHRQRVHYRVVVVLGLLPSHTHFAVRRLPLGLFHRPAAVWHVHGLLAFLMVICPHICICKRAVFGDKGQGGTGYSTSLRPLKVLAVPVRFVAVQATAKAVELLVKLRESL